MEGPEVIWALFILIIMYMCKHNNLKLITLKYLSRMGIFPKDIFLFKQVMRTKLYMIWSSSLDIVILEGKPAAQNCYFCPFKLWKKILQVRRYIEHFFCQVASLYFFSKGIIHKVIAVSAGWLWSSKFYLLVLAY